MITAISFWCGLPSDSRSRLQALHVISIPDKRFWTLFALIEFNSLFRETNEWFITGDIINQRCHQSLRNQIDFNSIASDNQNACRKTNRIDFSHDHYGWLWLVGFCHICRGSWSRRHWELERTQTVFTWIEGTLFTSLYLHSKFMVIHAERNKLWFASVIPLKNNNGSSWGVMRGRHQVTLLISVLHKKSHSRCCCLFSNISFYELKIIAFVYVFLIAFILFTIQMKKHNLFMCQLEHLPQFDSMRAPHYRHHHYYYYHYKIRIQREIWVCDWISGYALNSGDYA